MGSTPPLPEKTIIYRSKLPDIDIPGHLPLHRYCFQDLPAVANRPCLVHGRTGDVFTYAEVELTARRVAAGLHRVGIRRGDVIMLLLPNSPEFVFAFLGASWLGAVTTPANPFCTPAEICKQARSSEARLIVTRPEYVDKVLDLRREDGVVIVCADGMSPEGCLHFEELMRADEADVPAVEVRPDDVVALPYSSGTTGLPKGVMLTHRGLVTSVAQQVDGENPNLWIRRDDVILCVLPLFHIYALNSVFLCGLRAKATILLVPKFEAPAVMELVQRHRVTVAPFVPPIVLTLTKSPLLDHYDLTSIRTAVSGAAPMGTELEEALRAKIPAAVIAQGYGMTEAGAVLAMSLAFAKAPFRSRPGSCGTVVRNAELKVVDLRTGASLPRNQSGEICIRGPQIMKGYLNDPEATARTIDGEGWLHTGDIGYVDDDDELFIVDRLKELIKYKGFQVAPAELEAMLISLPDVADAAVIPMKDEVAGEVPVAFVVKSVGSAISEDEIRHSISKQVVFYKRIRRVFFVEAIPKALSGKVLRRELRAKLAGGFAAVDVHQDLPTGETEHAAVAT